ncbi:hypothetical protein [Kribbella sp. NPDC023855]|uniref:hypothetical protein n=1 Tax=Kribbella sp. NPDC023855 TaxID=3154698 RepID=UPI0033CF21F6
MRGNVVTDGAGKYFVLGIYTDDTIEYVTIDRNVVHGYQGSIGCANEDNRAAVPNRPGRRVRSDSCLHRDHQGRRPPLLTGA